jgi:FMN phosphatase YigB (HAD superfamily)
MRKKTFNKEVILDLDYTLFDTARFKQALAQSLNKFGVKADMYFKTYPLAVVKHNGQYSYSINRHLHLLKKQVINLPILKSHKQINNVVAHSYLYLYPDTIAFLKLLHKHNFKLILVTRGNKIFQRRKVNNSGLSEYFNKVVTLNDLKVIVLKKLTKRFDQVFFVSDYEEELRQVKHDLPQLLPIMKLNGHGTLSQARKMKIPAFSSLAEMGEFILQYYK